MRRVGICVLALGALLVGCREESRSNLVTGYSDVGAQNTGGEEAVSFSRQGPERPTGLRGREVARWDPSGQAYQSGETREPAKSGGAPLSGNNVLDLVYGSKLDERLHMNGMHANAWGRELMAMDQTIIKLREQCLTASGDEKAALEARVSEMERQRTEAAEHPERVF